MGASGTPIEGVVAADEAGNVLFASGIGNDSRVKALVSDQAWRAEIRERRLQPLILDRNSYAVLDVPMSGGDLLVISRPKSNALLEFIGSVEFAYDILEHMLTDPFEAMTIVDADARLVYISPVHESFFGLQRGEANGKPVKEVIENTRLDQVVATGKAEVGEIQRMRGLDRVVSRIPIRRDGRILGAVGRVMFKGPQQVEELGRRIHALESEVEFYKRETAALRSKSYGLDQLIGDSPAMRRLRDEIVKVAPLEIPVLIRGESGTGKELVAQALHRLSPRRDAAIVMVNAAALPATLVESELFGYEPGAFTGAARKGRKGKFEQAAGGTIFLDEIGDMPIEVQSKLLRVLQDRMIERIGSDRPQQVDFRLVTATNRDLQQFVSEGKFRLDLYYRISPITIEVPPLKRRLDDIPALVAHFVADFSVRHRRPAPEITESALSWLMEQSWPGNVRQLRHAVERALIFADDNIITAESFAPQSNGFSRPMPEASAATTLRERLSRIETDLVLKALRRHNGNKKRVAQELGISRSYLYKILGEMKT
jgi:transcriptional regulator with PAS, ATPase and Fis domain